MDKSAAKKAREYGLPRSLTILGTKYQIDYVDNQIDCDLHQRSSLVGQIDWITSTIRIYVGDRRPEAIKKVIFHELIHGILMEFQILELVEIPDSVHERVVESIASGLYDTLSRNKMLQICSTSHAN